MSDSRSLGYVCLADDFVASVYSSTGVSMSPLEVDIIFQVFDDDDDGKLTPAEYEDFLQLVSERKQRAYTVNQWLTTANEIPVKNADEKVISLVVCTLLFFSSLYCSTYVCFFL